MSPRKLVWVFITLILATIACYLCLPRPVVIEDPEHQYIHKILLGTEFGRSQDRVCMRWKEAPKLMVNDPSEKEAEIIRDVVAEVNSSLPEAFRIQMVSDKSEASMHLYFIDKSDFQSTLKTHDISAKVPSPVNGYFHLNWKRRYELYRSVILIATDLLEDKELLHHVVLEETTQSLGLANDSDRFTDSVFYENLSTGNWGTAIRLSERDRKLIRLLYGHVEPGMSAAQLQRVVEEHWEESPL